MQQGVRKESYIIKLIALLGINLVHLKNRTHPWVFRWCFSEISVLTMFVLFCIKIIIPACYEKIYLTHNSCLIK